jgi:hypothetical protein
MSKRRDHGDGGIDARGPDSWRLRYRINGRRFSTAFHGSLREARTELRRLIRTGDTGEHVAPDKITLAAWATQWVAAGAPGRRMKRVGRKSLARYEQLLRVHVTPKLGARPLQQLQATEIDCYIEGSKARSRPRLHTMSMWCSAPVSGPRCARGCYRQTR